MDKFILLIYNPMAGTKTFPAKLDRFIEIMQERHYSVRIFRTSLETGIEYCFEQQEFSQCEAVIVAGGDGTINKVVTAMMSHDIDVPLGVIPVGTANDFANHIGIPMNINEAIDVVANMITERVDVGKVNDRYFINVCTGGLFANISQSIDTELKNTIGKLAYYIKGVQELPKFKTMTYKITVGEEVIQDEFILFLLLNGSSAGGFNKLGKDASLNDGYMDFVAIKECPVNHIPILFGKILNGDHLKDKYVEFFQCNALTVECLEGDEKYLRTDIDGEYGPKFPLEFEVLEKRLEVIIA